MSPPAHSIETILAAAVEIPDPAARAAYLDRACGPDPGLRERVGRLADDHFRAGSFLERPPAAAAPDETLSLGPAGGGGDEEPGAAIGPYTLLEKVGEGGMGAVYVAEQTHPVRRKVALKVIKPGMDSAQVVARFEAERQALALMDHPNIARVLDGGATDAGRPFFVMELVRGEPVTDYCDHARLGIPDRLRLFADVCRAVQHAHHKGVIHRDLKPSNVLVTVIDGHPVPKVIDFGIAKATGAALTDRTLHTGLHQLVGTPLYMAPEQAELSGVDVDTRADVYALGVVLYELLTGTTPFDPEALRKAGFDEMRRMIREDEPVRPSKRLSTLAAERASTVGDRRGVDPRRLGRLVRGELDWVVMRCLDKDRNRRYQSPADLAADVERYLAGEAVTAHPPSSWYRMRKFVRRNRGGLVTAGVAAAVLLAAGWVAADWGGRRAATHRAVGEALAESDELQRRGKYPEALDAARRAEGLAAGGSAGRDLRDRAARRRADLELVQRLEEVRLSPAADVRGTKFDDVAADRRYGEEFLAAGIDVDGLTPGEAGERVRATTVAAELTAALDHWTWVRRGARGGADAGWKHLLEVARQTDPDGFRCRVRDAIAAKDRHALEDLAKAEGLAGQPGSLLTALGNALEQVGATDRSVELLRAAQRRCPDDFWTNHALAFSLCNAKPPQTEEALRFYTAAVALRPHSPGTRLNFGNAFHQTGRLDEAVAQYREAIRLKPDYRSAHLNLGRTFEKQGRLPDAVVALREAVRLDPDADAYVQLADHLFMKQRDWSGAEAAYREAIRLGPDYPERVYYNLGLALAAQGRLDEAEAAYREAIRLGSSMACDTLDQLLRRRGKPVEAEATLREAIRLNPDDLRAHAALGDFLRERRKWAEADAEYREVLRLKPDHAGAHHCLGMVLREQRRFDEAEAALREAIRLFPAGPKSPLFLAHHELGIVLAELGKYAEADAEFQSCLRLKPDYMPGHVNLAWLLVGVSDRYRDPSRAIALAGRAVELNPKQGQARTVLGVAHYRGGDWKAAVEMLNKAVELKKGGDANEWFFLAMAQWQLGEKDKAREWYAKGVAWADKNKPQDEDLRRSRAEAAELLGVLAPPPREKKAP